jgi:hypothetical protein
VRFDMTAGNFPAMRAILIGAAIVLGAAFCMW